MRVCVANPPAYFKEYPNRHFVQAGSRWSFSTDLPRGHRKDHYQPYPFNLGYLSSWFKGRLQEVYPLDACAQDLTDEEFRETVHKIDPDLLIIEVPTVSFPPTMRVLREVHREVDCSISLMGAHTVARPQDVPDFASVYQYPYVEDLWRFPHPDREGFPIEMYHDFEFYKPTAQMLTSRGCPSNCSFCLQRHVLYGSPEYKRRSAKSVVDEMILCKEKHRARQIYFDDDTMTIVRDHVESICKEILARELEIPWTCMGDVTLKPETLRLMGKAGCIGVKFGVEAVNPKTLKRVGKHFLKVDKVQNFVKYCRDLGIWSHATYMIGLPHDKREDIKQTLKFAVELGSDSVQFSIATPFPGTPFFKQCEENGWLTTKDWARYDGARYAVVNYPWLRSHEIEELFREAMRIRKEHGLSMRDKL